MYSAVFFQRFVSTFLPSSKSLPILLPDYFFLSHSFIQFFLSPFLTSQWWHFLSLPSCTRPQSCVVSIKLDLCWCSCESRNWRPRSGLRSFLVNAAKSYTSFTESNYRVTIDSTSWRPYFQHWTVFTRELLTSTNSLTQKSPSTCLWIWSAPTCTSGTVAIWFPRIAKRVRKSEKATSSWTPFALIRQWVRSPFRVICTQPNQEALRQRGALKVYRTLLDWCWGKSASLVAFQT